MAVAKVTNKDEGEYEEKESKSRKVEESITSRPRASYGQRFPCPALLFSVFIGGSRAAVLIGDKVL